MKLQTLFNFIVMSNLFFVSSYTRKFLKVLNCSTNEDFYKIIKCDIVNNRFNYVLDQVKPVEVAMVKKVVLKPIGCKSAILIQVSNSILFHKRK